MLPLTGTPGRGQGRGARRAKHRFSQNRRPRHPDGSLGDLRDLRVQVRVYSKISAYLGMTSARWLRDRAMPEVERRSPLSPALSPKNTGEREVATRRPGARRVFSSPATPSPDKPCMSYRYRSAVAFVEELEPRSLFAVAFPSAQEQLIVELINRGRADPAAEATR